MAPLYRIRVRCLSAEQGGRVRPFGAARYTPTARFASESEQFSVVIDFANETLTSPTQGTLRLLNPDLGEVHRRIHPGAVLEIMEGSRMVAQCVLESADEGAMVGTAS